MNNTCKHLCTYRLFLHFRLKLSLDVMADIGYDSLPSSDTDEPSSPFVGLGSRKFLARAAATPPAESDGDSVASNAENRIDDALHVPLGPHVKLCMATSNHP